MPMAQLSPTTRLGITRRLVLVALGIALAGCGQGQAPSPPPTPSLAGQTSGASVHAGEAAATLDAVPETDNVLEATGSDGSAYRLEVPAFALAVPTTISLRPLLGATVPGATLVAGVEIEPAGLQLRLPAVLTVTPAAGTDQFPTATLAGFEYTGSANATAELAALGPGGSGREFQILLTHFSGGMVGSLDTVGENLWLQQGTFNTATADGRYAQADHAIRVLEHAVQTGKMTPEAAAASTEVWARQRLEAEIDRSGRDVAFQAVLDNANVNNAQPLLDQGVKLMRDAAEFKRLGDPDAADDLVFQAVQLEAEFARRALENLKADTEFQHKVDGGLVSDLGEVRETLDTLYSMAFVQALNENAATANALLQAFQDYVHRVAVALGCSCAQAGIDPLLAIAFLRMALLNHDQEAAAILEPCAPPTGGMSDAPKAAVAGWDAPFTAAASCEFRLVGTAHAVYRLGKEVLTLEANGVVWQPMVSQNGSYVFEIVAGQLTYTDVVPPDDATHHYEETCGSGSQPLTPDQEPTTGQNGGGGVGDGALLSLETALFDPPRYLGNGHVELPGCPLRQFDWFRADGYREVTDSTGGRYTLNGSATVPDVSGEFSWTFTSP
jgi:hypothetical protein